MQKFIINEKELGIFPHDKFEIYVQEEENKDRKLFHIDSDGFKMSLDCDTLELVSCNGQESQKEIYNYILSNIKHWSEKENEFGGGLTNIRQCQLIWDNLNGDNFDDEEEDGVTIATFGHAFEVLVFGKDKGEPHFHVCSEGLDLTFKMDTGELIEIISDTNDTGLKDYIINSAPKWLDVTSAMNDKLTNREVASLLWKYLHESHIEGEDTEHVVFNIDNDTALTINETDKLGKKFFATYKGKDYTNEFHYPIELYNALNVWLNKPEELTGLITNKDLVRLIRESLSQCP